MNRKLKIKIIPRVLFASVLVVLLSAFQSTTPEVKSTASQSIRIYAAAALFNGRETFFNVKLIEKLEQNGFADFLPQRDGFEFGQLKKNLAAKLPPADADAALVNIIYFLDMGVFVAQSDVVIANVDEPIDPGVAVEISYARLMGKTVIEIHTDVRTPYGDPGPFGGMHFFIAFQADRFIQAYMPSKSPSEAEYQLNELSKKIIATIKSVGVTHSTKLPDYVLSNPRFAGILKGAELLFSGIDNIHSEEGLQKITQRYLDNKVELEKLAPLSVQ